MSVRTMARVWADSTQAGSHLLMLLAIADFADDDGNAYPAVATLATKCRMKPRNANVILAGLRSSGELEVLENEGPRGTNKYRIVEPSRGVQSHAGLQRIAGLQELAGVQGHAGLQRIAAPPAKACSKPLQRLADEPSLNHQDPPSLARSRTQTQSRKRPERSKSEHALFAEFYAAYPRKAARARALKAFTALNPDRAALQVMLAAIVEQQYSDQWCRDGGKYIPFPASWLNGQRWEDQPPSAVGGRADRRGRIPDIAGFQPSDYEDGATVGVERE